MQPPGLGVEEILPDPEHRPRSGSAQSQGRDEARSGGQIGPGRGVDLMQSRARQATT